MNLIVKNVDNYFVDDDFEVDTLTELEELDEDVLSSIKSGIEAVLYELKAYHRKVELEYRLKKHENSVKRDEQQTEGGK